MSERLLVSTVGISEYEETTFVLNDQRTTASVSPSALTALLEPDQVLIAHTETVREETQYVQHLRDVCEGNSVHATFVEVPLVSGRDDIDIILDRLTTTIAGLEVTEVVLDVTHAFRSLQLAFYTSVVQLAGLGLVELEGIYYAENAGEGGTAQILDLTYLATLLEWYHALRSFRTAGTLGPLHELLESKRNRVYREGGEHPHLVTLESSIAGVSAYLDSGLPLEAGVAADHAVETLEELDDTDFIGPEGAFLDPLEEQLRRFTVDQNPLPEKKTEIDLTVGELVRQRDVILFYVETGRYWFALECARELFINRLLYTEYGPEVDWLDTDVRHESRIVLTELAREYRSTPEQPPEAIRVWDELSQYRNMHAHAGFDPNRTPTGQSVESVLLELCDSVTSEQFWTPLVGPAREHTSDDA